jgi:hypothetical protein
MDVACRATVNSSDNGTADMRAGVRVAVSFDLQIRNSCAGRIWGVVLVVQLEVYDV